MKNPNGYGSIAKLSGNRRNPYIVRITEGFDIQNEKLIQKRAILGYYPSKKAAQIALAEYNKKPFDIKGTKLTFSDIYKSWSEEYYKTLSNNSSARSYISAYNHSKPLHDMRMIDIRVKELVSTINAANVGEATKARMKSLYNLMFKYAKLHELVQEDYAALFEYKKTNNTTKAKTPFTTDEINKLWDNLSIPYVDMILIGIYSGWRPSELATLTTDNIDLINKTMIGGMKTDAGKNRIVPIHEKILPLIEKIYNPDNKTLFTDEKNQPMNYDKYRTRFDKAMQTLQMNHTKHETRHTFITLLKEKDVNEYIIKLLAGHYINDLTERTYTHRQIEDLRLQINKI